MDQSDVREHPQAVASGSTGGTITGLVVTDRCDWVSVANATWLEAINALWLVCPGYPPTNRDSQGSVLGVMKTGTQPRSQYA